MPLINCEVFLTLNSSKNFEIINKAAKKADPDAGPAVTGINNPTRATFKRKDTKLYVPVVILSAENDNKLLEQLKTKEQLNGINVDQKCLIRLKITI